MAQLRVAVIGGGWAGLAAAVELSSADAKVIVFEAAKQIGGRARRVEINGYALDNGQHILIGAYRDTLRLMQKVGVDTTQRLKRLPLELNYPAAGFRIKLPQLPATLHLVLGLLGAKGCTLSEKLSAMCFMRALQANHYQLTNDGTVAELLNQHQQQGKLRRYLWEPLCLSALNTAPEIASAQVFVNVLRESLGGSRAATDLLLPATDLSAVFPDAAARFITAHGGEIRLSTRIASIETDLQINHEKFDHVVLACAPQHTSALLSKITETSGIAALLETYVYEPIATVYLGYPPEVTLPSPMTGLGCNEYACLGQWAFDRGALNGQHGVISFVLSASGNWVQCDDKTLVTTLHHELEKTLGKTLSLPLWHQVIRERRATFSCRINLPRPSAQTPLHRLWLAGDYVCAEYPATLEGAIRSGITAATELLKHKPIGGA